MKPRAIWVRGAEMYAPEPLGQVDLLTVGRQIVAIGANLEKPPAWTELQEIDATGMIMVPGMIDQHVHIAGGGGEGGPQNRTPEISLTQLTMSGITTVVGLLGTDGTTRSVQELLAKARALEYEGLTAWIYTGAYEIPTRTVTGSIRSDIVLLDRALGVGEIALSDQRGSHPNLDTLMELASEARVGGLLANKAGVVHLHLGDGSRHLDDLLEIVDRHDLPIQTFVPTHLNRTKSLLRSAAAFGSRGGWLDITSGIRPEPDDQSAVDPGTALTWLNSQGIPWDHLSLSSDAQGSAPIFNRQGQLQGVGIGSAETLWQVVVDLVTKFRLPWTKALQPVTTTPAKILKLGSAGTLAVGAQADFLLIRDHRVDMVVAKGQPMVDRERPVVYGTFEKHRC